MPCFGHGCYLRSSRRNTETERPCSIRVSLGAAFDRVAPRIPTVIASASEAISGRECPLGRDCFVAQGAPRNDSGNLVKICSSAAQQRRFDLIFYCAAAELLG
jgi:hypothetical protein